MLRTLAAAAVCTVAAMVFPVDARACACAQVSVCRASAVADAIFIATAAVTPFGPAAQHVRLHVEEAFAGIAEKVVEVRSEGIGGSCDYGFENGKRYFVYARREPTGQFKVSLCGRTALVEDAAEDLVFARSIAGGQVRTGRLSGGVTIADGISG